MTGGYDDNGQEEHGNEHMHEATHFDLFFLIRIAIFYAKDIVAHRCREGCECAVGGREASRNQAKHKHQRTRLAQIIERDFGIDAVGGHVGYVDAFLLCKSHQHTAQGQK